MSIQYSHPPYFTYAILSRYDRLVTPSQQIQMNSTNDLNRAILTELSESLQILVEVLNLDEVTDETVPPGSAVITTVELDRPLLSTISSTQLSHLQILCENASLNLWLTCGSLYKASQPDNALILGLSRSLMLERPSLKMPVFDLDVTTSPALSARNVGLVLKEVIVSGKGLDTEYRQHDGVVYHSRFIPDVALNHNFRRVHEGAVIQIPFGTAGYCRIGMENVGQLDTLRFEEVELEQPLPKGYVEVQIRAMGINAKVSKHARVSTVGD